MGAEANKLVLIGTGTAVVGTGAVEPGRPSQPWSVSCVQPPHLRGGLRSPLSLGVLARIERGVRPWSAAQLVVSTQQEERLRGSACPPPPRRTHLLSQLHRPNPAAPLLMQPTLRKMHGAQASPASWGRASGSGLIQSTLLSQKAGSEHGAFL